MVPIYTDFVFYAELKKASYIIFQILKEITLDV